MEKQREQGIITLGNASLPDLSEGILRPNYDRSQLTPGIVHIGVGNFHRAHQSWYLHRLMQQGKALDWAIIGAGVRPYDTVMREKLLRQDCLSTLIELDPGGVRAEVVGPMIDYLPVEAGNRTLIRTMADPAVRIVSLTVTEGGYYIDPDSGGLDTAHPDIRYDAANPQTPKTAFGAMVAALQLRKEKGLRPFTGQSCDNLQSNGRILHRIITSLAHLSDPVLADWIDREGAFPNAMVDCIVPATGEKELALAAGFGIDDAAPVTHENFRQWVTEDTFCAGRPDWDLAGVTFSEAVHNYEAMKIRILNGGHQIIANVGEVLSISAISDCMAHPGIAAFFRKVQHEEIAPYVHAVPEMGPADYIDLIQRRFANPVILDTARRVAFDGSARHTGFVLPVLREALAAGGSIQGLSLVEAFWARMCEGTREDGSTIEPNDPHWEKLHSAGKAARTRPRAWLEQSQFYGDLVEQDAFAEAFCNWLTVIWNDGAEAALAEFTRSE